MENYQYYSNENPVVGELVLLQFTERTDSFFDAKLLEYNYRGMMSYQDATKKRKVYSWNKIIPMNKNMVVRVDEVDSKTKIVQVSVAYLNDEFEEDLTPEQIQDKLLLTFNQNRVMENFIKSYCIIGKYNFNDVWFKLVHHIDSLRQEYNEETEESLTLWKYFCDNFGEIETWIQNSGLNLDIHMLQKLFDKRTEEVEYKRVSKIGIISLGGVDSTKELIKNVLSKINYKYTLKYESTPYYLFETSSKDSTDENHKELVAYLEKASQNFNPKVFIKPEYLAKKIN